MLQAGIITPIESAWKSLIVLATKKDGSPRFCIEFRKLNAVMKSDKWPVPCVEEIFDDLRGSSVFSTLVLVQGYWKIKMDETCQEKTTFMCRFGTHQFEVMLLIEEFGTNLSKNDGQYLSEYKQCQVLC